MLDPKKEAIYKEMVARHAKGERIEKLASEKKIHLSSYYHWRKRTLGPVRRNRKATPKLLDIPTQVVRTRPSLVFVGSPEQCLQFVAGLS